MSPYKRVTLRVVITVPVDDTEETTRGKVAAGIVAAYEIGDNLDPVPFIKQIQEDRT